MPGQGTRQEADDAQATYQSGQSEGRSTLYTRVPTSRNLGALREIPDFEPDRDGSVNVQDFLEAVENAAFLGNLGDELMRIMPMRLRGSAKGFYRTFLASKQVNTDGSDLGGLWKDFKKGLNERFRKPTDSVAQLMQLTNCRQGDTETARSYAQRVKTLAFKTWPQFTQSQDEATRRIGENLIYQHFLKGLKPSNIERIHLKGIRDFDTAVLELTNKETFDDLQRTGDRAGRVNYVGAEGGAEASADVQGAIQELKETVSAHMAETAELLRAHAMVLRPSSVSYPEADSRPMPLPPPEAGAQVGIYDNQWPYGHEQAGTLQPPPTGTFGHEPAEPTHWGVSPYDVSNYRMYGSPQEGVPPTVNAVGYQPRLPQFPMLRQATPRGTAPVPPRSAGLTRAPVACYHCRGPHYLRDCPSLPHSVTPRYPTAGVPGQAPGQRAWRPIGPPHNYATRAQTLGQRMSGPALPGHTGAIRTPARGPAGDPSWTTGTQQPSALNW